MSQTSFQVIKYTPLLIYSEGHTVSNIYFNIISSYKLLNFYFYFIANIMMEILQLNPSGMNDILLEEPLKANIQAIRV